MSYKLLLFLGFSKNGRQRLGGLALAYILFTPLVALFVYSAAFSLSFVQDMASASNETGYLLFAGPIMYASLALTLPIAVVMMFFKPRHIFMTALVCYLLLVAYSIYFRSGGTGGYG